MEFDIYPSELLQGSEGIIRLPKKLREELGILEGQFLQLRGRQELVLQVADHDDESQPVALVSPHNFDKIKGTELEFKILDVTLGCDPEFFVTWGHRLISAATYLPYQGQIGCDGQLGEIRPIYARHEDAVVQNIGRLIPQIPARMKRLKWATGFPQTGHGFKYEAHSYKWGLAAGFHVHLGIPPEILNTRKDFSRAAMNHLVQCLDWYVSVPLVPLEADHTRRLGHTNYGKPGDYRPSNVTLEYRTPGAFYLRTPSLARGMMGLCLMATENIASRMKTASKNFVNLHKLTKADLNEIMPIPEPRQIKETLLARNSSVAQSRVEDIRENLEALPTYGKHKAGIEEFFRVVEEGKRPEADLLQNWKGVK